MPYFTLFLARLATIPDTSSPVAPEYVHSGSSTHAPLVLLFNVHMGDSS
jgi:hypothetical protein